MARGLTAAHGRWIMPLMSYEIGRYDPCPCGSGKKYKFCCGAEGKKATKKEAPVGTIARYGPDDVLTTKVIAGVVYRGGDPILKQFHGDNPHQDPAVEAQIKAFFFQHGVQQVVQTDGNVGCPHEEGIDFPEGADCPFCPFWKGKQGSAAKVHRL